MLCHQINPKLNRKELFEVYLILLSNSNVNSEQNVWES